MITHSIDPHVAQRKHNTAMRAVLSVVFWGVAALAVSIVHQRADAASPVFCAAVKVIAIVAMAGAYIKLAAPEASLDHALLIGTTWVLLGIATEIAMTTASGHQWFALLGAPANGGLRCVLLITWIIAPALFVRSRE
jgi:hypothetical protein